MGAGAFMQGLAGGVTSGRSMKTERSILDALEKSNAQPPASPANPTGATAVPVNQGPTRPRSREQGAPALVDHGFDPASIDPAIATGFYESADALGIDPIDLATASSYETAGTFNPRQKGPTTQWGQHEGLIQFGEPQAREHGVDWDNPVGSQLGRDGAVVKYLRKAGVKPGMGMLDIYSAINAGSVGRYDASDANNGGAAGSVRDKVNDQMAGHRAKAEALMNHYRPQQQAQAAPPAENVSTGQRFARSIFGEESNAEQLLRRFYKPEKE